MRLADRKELKELISGDVNHKVSLRDNHFEIAWNFNYGDDYWYIAHDGKEWNINQYLRPSQNQFKTMQDAINELKLILKERTNV